MHWRILSLLIFATYVEISVAACLVDPVKNPIVTGPYGKVRTAADTGIKGYRTSVHQGLDFVSTSGNDQIYAGSGGVIQFAGFANGYGNTVIIKRTDDKAGDYVAYRHLRSINVRVGQSVTPGQLIGIMGGSGSRNGKLDMNRFAKHLHNDYMVPNRSNAVQYEFNNHTKAIRKGFVNLGGKQVQERRAAGAYFTDPSPYYCNTFTIRSSSASPWAKDTKAQYNFILTKIGQTNTVNAGSPPSIGVYTAAQQQQVGLEDCSAHATGTTL